jgi:tetratricopeptide (TPR) repeat protein
MEALEAEARADYKAAADYYRQALIIKPNAIGLPYALGNALFALSGLDEAAAEYKKETEVNPNDSAALWKFGALTLHHDPPRHATTSSDRCG